MAFTLQQAQRMLLQARERGRLPHALLITGAEEAACGQALDAADGDIRRAADALKEAAR